LICMIGGKGKNCDDHPYSENLSKLLEISFVKLIRHHKDVYLAEWTDNLINTRDSFISVNNLKPKFADYECFLTVEENLKNNKLINFYKLIKESKRKKIFVGPAKLKKVQQMLNIDKFVTVPIIDAFSMYEQILDQLNEDKIDNNNIYILCCSMMSCILCYDLKEKNPNITILDIGSGFDPIFGEKTRPLQTSPINAYNYYRKILPKSYIFEKNKHARNSLNKMCSNY